MIRKRKKAHTLILQVILHLRSQMKISVLIVAAKDTQLVLAYYLWVHLDKEMKSSIPELDLHGVKHVDVESLVENFVFLNTLPVRIITGNSKKMRDIVNNTLKKHNYETTSFHSACITVLH